MSNHKISESHHNLLNILIGPPLETAAVPHQAIGKIPALAVFASDALSSVAYATEEILVVLAMAGSAYFGLSIPIAIAIVGLLLILTASYRQTIFAYPNGGGAYIVAGENLSILAAQIAGAALMTDYTLTVAVSISSGVAQVTSAFPGLQAYRVALALGLIATMTLINLRGVRESSNIFSIPTYFFLFMAYLTLLVGLWRGMTGSLGQVSGVPDIRNTIQPLSMFLLLRAFSSGCTALTGVEAISNGITAFKEPRSKNAAQTMLAMSLILMTLFLGITILAHQIRAVPTESDTVIAQIARTVFGGGPLYLITLIATTIILIMAANTSYSDFPRLAALLAGDGFLPRQLSIRGSRLVFSWGIVGLAGLASLLVVLFKASVNALIPLYAIGVFLSFTLSQTGMVIHWRKLARANLQTRPAAQKPTHYFWRELINFSGATVTAIVTIIFTATKFQEGAWITVLLIPSMVWIFFRIHHHYQRVASQLSLKGKKISPRPGPVRTLLLVDSVHAGTLRQVNFALSLGHRWEAIHIAVNPERAAEVQRQWAERIGMGKLKILESPYRSVSEPLRDYISRLQAKDPNGFIHLVVGQLAMPSFWEQALHNNTNLMIDLVLRDMDRVVITSVPYQINLSEQVKFRLQHESLRAGKKKSATTSNDVRKT
jgi:amino acid transporter